MKKTAVLFCMVFLLLALLATGGASAQTKAATPDTTNTAIVPAQAHLMDKDSIKAPPHNDRISIDKNIMSRPATGNAWQMLPGTAKILIAVCFFFQLVIITLMIMILSLRLVKSVRAETAKQAEKAFEEFIVKIIFAEEAPAEGKAFSPEQEEEIGEFAAFWLQNPFNREVVLNNILQLHRSLSGETAAQLESLYLAFGLEKDSIKKLKSKKWHIRAKGINELEQMQYRRAYREIYQFINNPNETLRSEAYLAIVSLKRKNHLSFLNNVVLELSDWQQIHLLDKINQVKNFAVPNMSRWLHGTNESIVKFSIKIIQYFNVVDQAEALPGLVASHWENVRIEAINALAFLQIETARDLLLDRFDTETQPVQLAILNAMATLGLRNDIEWLGLVADRHDLQLSQAAKQAIRHIQLSMTNY